MIVPFPFTFTFSVPGLPNPFSGHLQHFRPSSCPQALQVSREYRPFLDIQNGKALGDRSTALPTSSFSSPPSRPKNQKRGWDSDLAETIGQSSTALVSTSGYHGLPSKESVDVSDVHDEGVPYFAC